MAKNHLKQKNQVKMINYIDIPPVAGLDRMNQTKYRKPRKKVQDLKRTQDM